MSKDRLSDTLAFKVVSAQMTLLAKLATEDRGSTE